MSLTKKSLREFGLIWTIIFIAIGSYPLLYKDPARVWALYTSGFFLLISVLYPSFFKQIYFYQIWIKFGNVLGHINSKIILFILFYGIFTPIGLVLRLFGKDLLSTKFNKKASSYFVDRATQPGDMKNQF